MLISKNRNWEVRFELNFCGALRGLYPMDIMSLTFVGLKYSFNPLKWEPLMHNRIDLIETAHK